MEAPLLIVSPPGCGKTAGGRAYADTLGLPFYAHVGSQEDPIDTNGVMVGDHTTRTAFRYVPAYWRAACDAAWVLLFDEITAGTAEQLASLLRATDDSREMVGTVLHPQTRVIAACNPPEMAAGAAREIPAPALNRFRVRKIGAGPAVDWMRGGPGLVLHANVVPTPSFPPATVRHIGTYLYRNPAAALATPEEIRKAVETQDPFPSPRAWTRAAEVNEDDAWEEFVGKPAAMGWIAWRAKQDLPDPQDILAGSAVPIPALGDAVMATAGAIQVLLGPDPQAVPLMNAFAWFAQAASKGHKANCALAVREIIRSLGQVRAAQEIGTYLKPWKPLLDALGSAQP